MSAGGTARSGRLESVVLQDGGLLAEVTLAAEPPLQVARDVVLGAGSEPDDVIQEPPEWGGVPLGVGLVHALHHDDRGKAGDGVQVEDTRLVAAELVLALLRLDVTVADLRVVGLSHVRADRERNAPKNLSKLQLKEIFGCSVPATGPFAANTWGALLGPSAKGANDAIDPIVPQAGSGTLSFWMKTALGLTTTTEPTCGTAKNLTVPQQPEENEGTSKVFLLNGHPNPDVIYPLFAVVA